MQIITSKCTKCLMQYDNNQDYEIILGRSWIARIEFDHPGIIIHNNSSLFSLSNALLTTKGDKLCLCVSLLNGLKENNRCKTHHDAPSCTSAIVCKKKRKKYISSRSIMLQILSKNLKRLQGDAVEIQTSTIVMAWLSSTIYCVFLDFYTPLNL